MCYINVNTVTLSKLGSCGFNGSWVNTEESSLCVFCVFIRLNKTAFSSFPR